MKRRGSNHDTQKIAIWPPWMAEHANNCQEQFLPGLLGYSILTVDGRDLNLSIPYPYIGVRI